MKKEYEIWVKGLSSPKLVGTEVATSFQLASVKYELKEMLRSIDISEMYGDVPPGAMEWQYNSKLNSNKWTGQYYESYESAMQI